MAEIKIEKKKPVWPWVILILVVLGIIAYFVYDNRDDNDLNDDFDDDYNNEQVIDSTYHQSDMDTYDTRASYDQLTAFEESIADSTRIAVDSSYTKKAFTNLTKAVVQKANEYGMEESEALNDLQKYSTLHTPISGTDNDTEGFKNFKTTSDKIAQVLEAIQAKNFPSLQAEVADLKDLASKIDGSVTMTKQQGPMNSFLKQSRHVLQSMNNLN